MELTWQILEVETLLLPGHEKQGERYASAICFSSQHSLTMCLGINAQFLSKI